MVLAPPPHFKPMADPMYKWDHELFWKHSTRLARNHLAYYCGDKNFKVEYKIVKERVKRLLIITIRVRIYNMKFRVSLWNWTSVEYPESIWNLNSYSHMQPAFLRRRNTKFRVVHFNYLQPLYPFVNYSIFNRYIYV